MAWCDRIEVSVEAELIKVLEKRDSKRLVIHQ
jgi:hypothetical protein